MNSMSAVARAFGVLAEILAINGRRKLRGELEIKMHLRQPEQHNRARVTSMESRARRRARVKEVRKQQALLIEAGGGKKPNRRQLRDAVPFRPVIGYVGPKAGQ